jgi:hypothetical protein
MTRADLIALDALRNSGHIPLNYRRIIVDSRDSRLDLWIPVKMGVELYHDGKLAMDLTNTRDGIVVYTLVSRSTI